MWRVVCAVLAGEVYVACAAWCVVREARSVGCGVRAVCASCGMKSGVLGSVRVLVHGCDCAGVAGDVWCVIGWCVLRGARGLLCGQC